MLRKLSRLVSCCLILRRHVNVLDKWAKCRTVCALPQNLFVLCVRVVVTVWLCSVSRSCCSEPHVHPRGVHLCWRRVHRRQVEVRPSHRLLRWLRRKQLLYVCTQASLAFTQFRSQHNYMLTLMVSLSLVGIINLHYEFKARTSSVTRNSLKSRPIGIILAVWFEFKVWCSFFAIFDRVIHIEFLILLFFFRTRDILMLQFRTVMPLINQ